MNYVLRKTIIHDYRWIIMLIPDAIVHGFWVEYSLILGLYGYWFYVQLFTDSMCNYSGRIVVIL